MLLIFLNHLKTSGKYFTTLKLSGKLILIFFFFVIKILIFLVFLCPNRVSTPFLLLEREKTKLGELLSGIFFALARSIEPLKAALHTLSPIMAVSTDSSKADSISALP